MILLCTKLVQASSVTQTDSTQASYLGPKIHSLCVLNQTFVNDQFFCSYMFRKTPNYTIHNVVILFTRAEDITMVSHTETTGSTTADEPQEDARRQCWFCGFFCCVRLLQQDIQKINKSATLPL